MTYTIVIYDGFYDAIAKRTTRKTLEKAKTAAKAMFDAEAAANKKAVWLFAGTEHITSPVVYEYELAA